MTIVFGSLSQMVSEAGLSGIVGAALSSVERMPLGASHFSGNSLERITAVCDGRPTSLILKRFTGHKDWVSRLTHDSAVREVALYRCGIYELLPEDVCHPALAAARDGESWALLMDDVSPWLQRSGKADDWRHIANLASLHAAFWLNKSMSAPDLGLSSLTDYVTIFSPHRIAVEVERGHSDVILAQAAAGWGVFRSSASPEVVRLIGQLQEDPSRLLDLLQSMPATLVHGDFKAANIGLQPRAQGASTVLLDWQDAAFGPGLLDLAYWLAVNPTIFPLGSKDQALVYYRSSLAQHGLSYSDADWDRDLSVCLVAGGALRLLWQMALRLEQGGLAARSDFDWWLAKVAGANRYLARLPGQYRWRDVDGPGAIQA